MAIRGPIRKPLPVAPSAGADTPVTLGDVEKQLMDAGLAKDPQEAKRLAKELLAALQKKGGKGTTDQQLKAAIRELQKSAGFPETGKLDAKTKELLQEMGVLPRADAKNDAKAKDAKKSDPTAGVKKPTTPVDARKPRDTKGQPNLSNFGGPSAVTANVDGPKRGIPSPKLAYEEAAQRADYGQAPKNMDLSNILDGLARLGFFGAGKGADKLKDAVLAFQSANGLPESGQLDPATRQALEKAGVHDKQAAQEAGGGAKEAAGDNAKAHVDNEGASANAPTSENASAQDAVDNPYARAEAANAGLTDRQEGAAEKAIRKKKGKGGRGGDADGEGDGEGDEGMGAADGADSQGEDDRSENASSGDDNLDDTERGHASLKREDADRGHYEVPALSVQVKHALETIVRVETRSGATAYAWDVTFYRPGIYGAGQTAEPLWHVAVDEASAFDPVWVKAREVLSARLEQMEPAFELTDDMFTLALRRARVRD